MEAAGLEADIKADQQSGRKPDPDTVQDYRRVSAVLEKVEFLTNFEDDWVYDRQGVDARYGPSNPAPWAEKVLFRGIPHIVLTSATVTPRSATFLGVSEDDIAVLSYPSAFPVEHRPVYMIPVARMHHRMTDAEMDVWLSRIDYIISTRQDRKGIIHTTSYQRAAWVLERSRFAHIMVSHDQRSTRSAVERFKRMPAPAVLVSPSVTTGHDFPGDDCRYIVISKVPFPSVKDKFVKARQKLDADYPAYMAMQTLVQSAGRGVRSADDRCECVSPETPILTEDLRWVEAHTLRVGDEILGFDEQGGTRERRRSTRPARVEKALTRTMNRVRVRTARGDLICTPNHMWLVFSDDAARMSTWKRSDKLKPGDILSRYFEPWTDTPGYEEGWLGGMMDGEGCLVIGVGHRNPRVNSICISQNPGPVLDRVKSYLGRHGFEYNESVPRKCHVIRVGGGFPEHMRLLGLCRPTRLLEKLRAEGAMYTREMRVTDHVEVLGVDVIHRGPITSLQTDTKTYVADGYGAHNTFIIDSQAMWFLRKYRRFAPRWFTDSIQYPSQIPGPPPLKD